ncbi:MAG TPA: cytochrome c peroxidase [Thermoanaerobaculia bacterium]|nr:cytochrome c peroxidase [Thermoanaerobaculia bacterium]
MPIDRISRSCAAALAALLAGGAAIAQAPAGSAPTLALLGQKIFFDTSLSRPAGQACADCHGPAVGFTGPNERVNRGGGVYPGAVHGRFGNRKPPSAAYAAAPTLATRSEEGETVFFGGSFWDGRATGARLDSALAEQALGPFLNPLEQNMPDAAAVVAAVCSGPNGGLLRRVAKDERRVADACAPGQAAAAYDVIGLAIAAYETSPAAQPFSSRYDRYLAGTEKLTPQEMKGLSLFGGKGKCGECHPHERRNGQAPLFTDFTYDNIGLPANPANPFYAMGAEYNPDGKTWKDPGLGGYLKNEPRWASLAPRNMGKFKVPTLRNVDRRPSPGFVKAYGHNGVFKSLEEVVHFYNTRDVLPVCGARKGLVAGKGCWPASEEPRNLEHEKTGRLGLTADEETAIVAFLKTLSDEGAPRR